MSFTDTELIHKQILEKVGVKYEKKTLNHKVSSSYHLSVECFSQLSFDAKMIG